MDIGIDDKNSAQVVKILNRVLADEYVLYTKTRGYHWNVTGMQFNDFHKFFEAQYTALEGIVDDVAERARTVGGRTLGSLQEMLDQKTLEEDTTQRDGRPTHGALAPPRPREHNKETEKRSDDLRREIQRYGDERLPDRAHGNPREDGLDAEVAPRIME